MNANTNNNSNIHLTAVCLGEWVPEMSNQSGFTGARDSEWVWHQLGHMQTAPRLRQTTTPAPHHSVVLQVGCPSCHPTNSVTEGQMNASTLHSYQYVNVKHLSWYVGVHFPSLNSLLSRRIHVADRSFSLSFATSGTHMGYVSVYFCSIKSFMMLVSK